MAVSAGINKQTGRPLTDWDHVVQSIKTIFETKFGERVMRRVFGSAVSNILGQNLVPSTMLKFYTAISIALEMWEPRFQVRRFEYPASENSADHLRQGMIGIRMIGDYRPRALDGDFTVESVRTISM